VSALASPRVEAPSRGVALRRWMVERPLATLAVLLVVELVCASAMVRGFFSIGQLPVILLAAAIVGTFAAGQTMAVLTGGIDLSASAVATAAGFAAAQADDRAAVAILGALLFGALIGAINGVGVGFVGVHPLIMTLGVGGALTGGLLIYTSRMVHESVPPALVKDLTTTRIFDVVPSGALVWLGTAALLLILLNRTRFGRLVYAVGDNAEACRISGVRVGAVLLLVYTIAGMCAGLGGLLLAGYSNSSSLGMGDLYLLPSVAAVVIGGTSIMGGIGGLSGTVAGTLILSVLDTLLNVTNTSKSVRQLLYGLVILLVASVYGKSGDER